MSLVPSFRCGSFGRNLTRRVSKCFVWSADNGLPVQRLVEVIVYMVCPVPDVIFHPVGGKNWWIWNICEQKSNEPYSFRARAD